MSISTTTTTASFLGNGSTSTPYPLTGINYVSDQHIKVYADGVLISTDEAVSDYCTFTGDGTTGAGQFTTSLAYADTVAIEVFLTPALDQPVVLQETGSLPAKTLENQGFDRLNMQIRWLARKVANCFTLGSIEDSASTGTADNLIGFDGSGNIAEIPNTTFLQTANDLSEVDAATARTNLGVDPAGTDNSTDVTKTGAGTYVSLAGQVLTVDAITESDISDLGAYIANVTGSPLSELQDVTITTPSSGQILSWNGSAWVNSATDAVGGMLSSVYDPNTVGSDAFDSVNHTYTPAGTGAVDTVVETKLRESVSVKDFGAVGDGVTDDTAAIQAAVSASYSKTLFFPKGTYLVSETIDVDFGLTLQGEQGSVIKFAPTITSSNSSFHNIFLVSATTAASRNLSKFVMRDLKFNGVDIDTSYWLEDSNGTTITDPEADYVMGTGALASGITGTSLTATLTGTAVSSVAINNGGSGWKSHPTYPYLSDDVPLQFTGGGGYGAQGFATISGGTLTSVTILDGGVGYTSAPTVTALGGYASIDLLTDVSVDRRNPNYTDVHGVVWTQNTQDCVIENCIFQDIAGRVIFDQGSINLDINNCTFVRCGKRDGAFHVIYAQNSTANPSEHIKIRNCRSFDSDRSFAGFMPKAGGLIENCYIDTYKEAAIFISPVANEDGNQIVIKNNVIKNGTASDIVCHAIEAGGVSNLIIDGNYIENCEEYPLVLTGVTEGYVINNTFVNNGSRYLEPYAPFAERYNYQTTSYPIAGRENGLEDRASIGQIGSAGSVASKWLSVKNNTVKETGRTYYPKSILKQSKSGTDLISRGGFVGGNVFDVPADVAVLNTSVVDVWEYPYFPRIQNNLNSESTAPVIHFKQFAISETGIYTVDVGFMPSYIQVFAAPNNATLGRSGQGYISFNGDDADNDFTFISGVDVGANAYSQMAANEFMRISQGDGTYTFSAEFNKWTETGFSTNVITSSELTNVRFVCYP